MLLYAVTDRDCLKNDDLYTAVEKALKGGITMVQLREKNICEEDFIHEAKNLLPLCRKYNVPLIINDNVSVALQSGADGVHLGQGDMPVKQAREILGDDKIIGVTAKTVSQAVQAYKDGADYLGSGAVFGTLTKSDAVKMSMDTLKNITSSVPIPVAAIGGINNLNIDDLENSGIAGAAVVSGIFAKSDIQSAAEELKAKCVSMFSPKTALTAAGSDCSGGAGIQADLKTFHRMGVYGMSVITSITSQNTTGVFAIHDIPPENVKSQLDAVFCDIYPDSVKIGMVSSEEIINALSEGFRKYKAKNIVLDPVMVSTSGHSLLDKSAVNAVKEKLFPLAELITPNIPEAELLCQFSIKSRLDMEKAAHTLSDKYNVSVLLKGGHAANTGSDFLFTKDGKSEWFLSRKINNPNTHGTGCTLSSAISAGLALGKDLKTAVYEAKLYITSSLQYGLDLGSGSGPLWH